MLAVLLLQGLYFNIVFLQNFYIGYARKLKFLGRGDTSHRQQIPDSSMDAIMGLLRLLQGILRCKDKEDKPEYRDLVEKLPTGYEDIYHFLIQYAIVFQILSLFGKRAKEGIDTLTKGHFEKKYDDKQDYYYWKKGLGQASKNYK